jgi:hypothetical protein
MLSFPEKTRAENYGSSGFADNRANRHGAELHPNTTIITDMVILNNTNRRLCQVFFQKKYGYGNEEFQRE